MSSELLALAEIAPALPDEPVTQSGDLWLLDSVRTPQNALLAGLLYRGVIYQGEHPAIVDPDQRIHGGHEFIVAMGFATARRQEIEVTIGACDEPSLG